MARIWRAAVLAAAFAMGPIAAAGQDTATITLANLGGPMGGHTPRGFAGMGTGLFTGDNLNPRFPNGDGVQIFVSFDLRTLPPGRIVAAELRSTHGRVRGMPFKDLGALVGEEIRFERVSPALWNQPPLGTRCILATTAAGPVACDVAAAVQRSRDDGYPLAQFRVRLEQAGDGDGQPDLVMFFLRDTNTNEPGIFALEVTVGP